MNEEDGFYREHGFHKYKCNKCGVWMDTWKKIGKRRYCRECIENMEEDEE